MITGDPDEPWNPYDPGETAEEDLWFLPGPDPEEEDVPPGAPPLPRADRRRLFEPGEWLRAQQSLGTTLAQVALLFGELDSRLRNSPDGIGQRLALREGSALSWWTGDRISPERLGLWVSLRIGSTEDTEQGLVRAGWAVQRLMGGRAPAQDLAGFLDRPSDTDETETPHGSEPGALADLQDSLEETRALHPLVQAALLFETWRIVGPERTRDMEAAVLAACHAARMSRKPGQGALFHPLALTGPGAFRGQGDPERKLTAWFSGAEQATLSALLHLEQVTRWRARAGETTADLSGRTPAQLLDTLASWPMITAPMAEAETGAARATVQRNLNRLAERGLIREITGQGRYRVWTADF